MALSMDEQRMLAEIERRLAAEDPGLAARLSSFRRPGPMPSLRSQRVRIIGSVLTVALVAVVSLMVYAMIPLRAHSAGRTTENPQASPANPALTIIPGTSSGTGAGTGTGTGTEPAAARTSASGTKTTASIAPQGTSANRQPSLTKTPHPKAAKRATSPAVTRAP